MKIKGHGIAIAIMSAWLPAHPEDYLRAQCECGYAACFESPISLERINQVMAAIHNPHVLSEPTARLIDRIMDDES